MTESIWIIPVLPLLGFLINGIFGKKLGKGFVSIVGPGVIFLAFLFSVVRFWGMINSSTMILDEVIYSWMSVGDFQIDIALRIDRLSGIMLLVVTGVGFLIHLYSIGYMRAEVSYYRYFSYLNLFIFFMLLLILGSNFVVMFLGWEGVGLCSYLLIGYYLEKQTAGDAAKKAFIVNRIGDFGFILGMLLLFISFGSLEFQTINQTVGDKFANGFISQSMITAITLLLFIGACGKSAQIPLYVWLPDAMEGPTPVSALIHAATMVTSGLYMIARTSHLFILSSTTMTIIAVIGGVTAIMAATIGIVQNDIKKVLAYSTVSQLGYMFLAVGVGAFSAGIFHVFTHAFFKALLFLGAGSVIHALHHEQDLRNMGGLRRKLPITWFTFAVGTWALAGLPLGAGFFSKDEILWMAFSSPLGSPVFWLLGFIAAGCTAFYMYRLVNLAFYGKSRMSEKVESQTHESPWTMTLPLLILAICSAFAGFLAIPHVLHAVLPFPNVMENYFHGMFAKLPVEESHGSSDSLNIVLMTSSILLAFLGFYFGRKFYHTPSNIPAKTVQKFKTTYALFLHKYYVDELYNKYIVGPIQQLSEKTLWKGIDIGIIDEIVNAFGWGMKTIGSAFRLLQTGLLQQYAFYMLAGVILLLGFFV